MKALIFISLFAVAGCLTASKPQIVFWPVDYVGKTALEAKPKYQVGRVSSAVVRAPYGDNRLAVLRANGSIVFDDMNEYAASPAMLSKGIVMDAMRASGLFKSVVGSSSSVSSDVAVEVLISRLVLDCRESSTRNALAEVKVRIVADGVLVGSANGEGVADASDGCYGAAFSKALSSALDSAFASLGK